MALQKEIVLKNGVLTKYHRIMRAVLEFTENNKTAAMCEVGMFINSAARHAGCAPVERRSFQLEVDLTDDVRTALYIVLSKPQRKKEVIVPMPKLIHNEDGSITQTVEAASQLIEDPSVMETGFNGAEAV